MTLKETGLKISHYKCFGEEAQGFESIRPINLIIGRNNSGKSALLDLVHQAITPRDLEPHRHKGGKSPSVFISGPLTQKILEDAYGRTNSYLFQSEIGKRITFKIERTGNRHFIESNPPLNGKLGLNGEPDALVHHMRNPLQDKRFVRLNAERDLKPEGNGHELPSTLDDGTGVTNLIRAFLTEKSKDAKIVERDLLADLNHIFTDEQTTFDRIEVKLDKQTGAWEICLHEKHKDIIPLSSSGSGLKTIILVLAGIHLIPKVLGVEVSEIVYAFEELENNLHPALQRRLALYLRKYAVEKGCTIFMTTHSNVSIDLFSSDTEAQIIHVTHNGQSAKGKGIVEYSDKTAVLDDLDVRASDLLQANCVVWVEGPTDRTYFNRWIELWTQQDGNRPLREGADYQCVFYGGRLLAHLSAEANMGEMKAGINILHVNRNAVLLIDSDKRGVRGRINETKKRMIAEINEVGGLSWITKGREVENYIPQVTLARLYPKIKLVGSYQEVISAVNKFDKGIKKVLFSERVVPFLTKVDLDKHLDMSIRMKEVIAYIKKCNGYKF